LTNGQTFDLFMINCLFSF